MFPGMIITFRETLEAAIVVSIVLAYLAKTKQKEYYSPVYWGIGGGILASLIGAVLFTRLAGGFEGAAEEIFEGIAMLAGATLLTTLIVWMLNNKDIEKKLRKDVSDNVQTGARWGLFTLVFVSILREGIETVLFLYAASVVSTNGLLAGSIIGILLALGVAYLGYKGFSKTKWFFSITSVLLILFSAGLVAHGIHELQEAHVIPTVVEHVWDINPESETALFHEKGVIGSFLKQMFGYNGNPNLLEVLAYLFYLGGVFIFWGYRTVTNIKKV